MVFFESTMIRLRRFHEGDLEFLLELETDEETMKSTGIGRALPEFEVRARLDRILESAKEPPPVFLSERSCDSLPVAWMMLLPTQFDSPEIGFMVPRRLWGQGLGTEAVRTTIQYGFEELRLPRIYATTSSDNFASQRVLTKCGMHHSTSTLKGQRETLHVYVTERPGQSTQQ